MKGAIARAADRLRHGGVVGFPTETVYGIGADAANDAAVQRIFALKGRPDGKPLSILLGRVRHPEWYAQWTPEAQRLAERFWPGPLTIVLPRTDRVPDAVTGGLDTVGLRVPDHPVALDLLDAFGGGLAAPSANLTGQPPATSAAEVVAAFGDRLDAILDGGPCRLGTASTVLTLVGPARVLRVGAIAADEIAAVLGRAVAHG